MPPPAFTILSRSFASLSAAAAGAVLALPHSWLPPRLQFCLCRGRAASAVGAAAPATVSAAAAALAPPRCELEPTWRQLARSQLRCLQPSRPAAAGAVPDALQGGRESWKWVRLHAVVNSIYSSSMAQSPPSLATAGLAAAAENLKEGRHTFSCRLHTLPSSEARQDAFTLDIVHMLWRVRSSNISRGPHGTPAHDARTCWPAQQVALRSCVEGRHDPLVLLVFPAM